MTGNIQVATTVLGGLALFIYGMGLMSEGLTQVAGARMKAILGYVTKNRVAAIAAGAGITALIQSSSATTVMTVGFVNAGLLSLTQAIGVVFGANIGTTVTGQLVSLKVTDLALPAVVLGVAGLMIARRSMMCGAWRTVPSGISTRSGPAMRPAPLSRVMPGAASSCSTPARSCSTMRSRRSTASASEAEWA